MNLVYHLARNDLHRDDDDLVIRRLGFRLFNSMASAVSAVMTGYHQTAVMVSRDILETHFLIDYFSIDKTRIALWRTVDEKERSSRFSAIKIRMALDDRDGFTQRRREEHYKLLCNLGAHPSMQGFRLLEPALDGFSQCGPFFSLYPLDAVGSELAKIAVSAAGQYTLWFEAKSVTDHQVKLSFATAYEDWLCWFYGKEPNPAVIEGMRRALARAEQAAESP